MLTAEHNGPWIPEFPADWSQLSNLWPIARDTPTYQAQDEWQTVTNKKNKRTNAYERQDEYIPLHNRFNVLSNENNNNSHLTEIEGDVFNAGHNVSLVHCVGKDLNMDKGIAKHVKQLYGNVDFLKLQNKQVGQVAVLPVNDDKYIFYLVTKMSSKLDPKISDVKNCLTELKKLCFTLGVTDIAMPRICTGCDHTPWASVRPLIDNCFRGTNIDVKVYTFNPPHTNMSQVQWLSLPPPRQRRGTDISGPSTRMMGSRAARPMPDFTRRRQSTRRRSQPPTPPVVPPTPPVVPLLPVVVPPPTVPLLAAVDPPTTTAPLLPVVVPPTLTVPLPPVVVIPASLEVDTEPTKPSAKQHVSIAPDYVSNMVLNNSSTPITNRTRPVDLPTPTPISQLALRTLALIQNNQPSLYSSFNPDDSNYTSPMELNFSFSQLNPLSSIGTLQSVMDKDLDMTLQQNSTNCAPFTYDMPNISQLTVSNENLCSNDQNFHNKETPEANN